MSITGTEPVRWKRNGKKTDYSTEEEKYIKPHSTFSGTYIKGHNGQPKASP